MDNYHDDMNQDLLDVCRSAVVFARRIKEYVGIPPNYTRPTDRLLDCDGDVWDKADQLFKAAKAAISKATVPLATATPNRLPIYWANSRSNSLHSSPVQ